MRNFSIVVALLFLGAVQALAADPRPAKETNVLDFDADIIEGQKKAPDIFLQADVERPSIDTVLYQRRDFNDFHAMDSRLRPRLADTPRVGSRTSSPNSQRK